MVIAPTLVIGVIQTLAGLIIMEASVVLAWLGRPSRVSVGEGKAVIGAIQGLLLLQLLLRLGNFLFCSCRCNYY